VVKSRRMRLVGHVASMGKMRTAYTILARKLEWKTSHEKLGVDERIILKLLLKVTGCVNVEWIQLPQNEALVKTLINFRVP
jgi:phage gp16-like protein